MISVSRLDPRARDEEAAELLTAHLASLTCPLDGMWEAIIAASPHFELRRAGHRVGFLCATEEGRLLQFYLAAEFERHGADIFAQVLARRRPVSALASTGDPFFLSLCLDVQRRARVHTYLYAHDPQAGEEHVAGAGELRVVEGEDLERIEEFQRQVLDDDPGEWLPDYLRSLQSRRELYVLESDGEILGTGEARVSETQLPYVDLGVIVSRPHRGRGVATDILRRLAELAYRRGQRPICSTTVENVAAQRAIAKAGFVARHRLLELELRPPPRDSDLWKS